MRDGGRGGGVVSWRGRVRRGRGGSVSFSHEYLCLPLLEEHVAGIAVLLRRDEEIAAFNRRDDLADRIHQAVGAAAEVWIDEPDVVDELEAGLLNVVLETDEVDAVFNFAGLRIEFRISHTAPAQANLLRVEDVRV